MKEKKLARSNVKPSGRARKIAYTVASLVFILLLTLMFGFSFNFVDRESFSESEKRELAKFPEFSFSALFNGDYFDGINLWFSDTFPFRDAFVKSSADIKKFLGIGQTIHNFSENNGDDIPEMQEESQSIVDITPVVPEQQPNDDLMKPALPSGGTDIIPSGQGDGENVLEQTISSIFIHGNTGYEYYNFVRGTADKYINAINSAADDAASNSINFYNMIIPTSIDITLNEASRSKLNSSDQKEAINYIHGSMNDNVKKVQIFDLLKAHSSEYLYYRTDHHWTSLAAYYAYAQFMTVKGVAYKPLSEFTQYTFPDFLGSFYSDTGKASALSTPDTVYAYVPPFDIKFSMMQKGSSSYTDWPLISDASTYSSSYKYLCFIGGDNPVSLIENNSMESGETCILVKESFGNPFAPYLSCNYKNVYVIDYRYFNGDITDFAKEKGATDIIVQSNISMTRNASLVDKLSQAL